MDTGVGLDWIVKSGDEKPKTIKVIGIGGGGVNAVDYMYKCGIKGVNFAVCNTDEQSFDDVTVPVKVKLGSGEGAGGVPETAMAEFEKSASEVEKLLTDGTRMVFISAGMGGGTGSGAGPLLAKMAKERGLLTVGIVTIPFLYEKIPRIKQALEAVERMSQNVDALILINNERLKDVYPDFDLTDAFKKPNEVLAMAVKSIAEIITVKGIINRDFKDVTTTMKDSGVALVSYGFGKGEGRLDMAIEEALHSPLLNNSDIYNAKRILIYISFKRDSHFKVEELNKSVDVFMAKFDNRIKMNWGFGIDDSLTDEQEVKFTIIATGFGLEAIPDLMNVKTKADENEEEENIEIVQRIEDIYNKKFTSDPKLSRVLESKIIILSINELDDENLIAYIEKFPPCNRSVKAIDNLRKPRSTVVSKAEPEPEAVAVEADNKDFVIEMV